jgi:hypothetical protein
MVPHGNRDREKVGLRTDSSTAPFGTIRLLLSFYVLLKLRLSSINIYGAYLQAEPPTRDIFVRPHPGWAPSGIVWKIIRPAYGLWKAVVYGNWPLKVGLPTTDSRPSLAFPDVYFSHYHMPHHTSPGQVVDDLLVAGSINSMNKFHNDLSPRFKIGRFICNRPFTCNALNIF